MKDIKRDSVIEKHKSTMRSTCIKSGFVLIPLVDLYVCGCGLCVLLICMCVFACLCFWYYGFLCVCVCLFCVRHDFSFVVVCVSCMFACLAVCLIGCCRCELCEPVQSG